ncbi:Sjogren's syndrome/scleroderma autoantigen 1 family protein [Ignisphaera sp. 4213-co]|uniref:Sjogren's syndrome/scleroderma autoantigen 1 family protein n=1 Tax=Ignisphaera cupida TaxID=3050454 RepID=A0ABD4Z6W0_9CREN|nr:Sjogren's syndrome/scleroderma autoantigen 1 family protein [Ignisphaera sp. 4213-co]MDK6029077.1 Sjogren's syndrome/scleroderma autoantigen 1 family protein [Ignisphaera sp. 4213-co]
MSKQVKTDRDEIIRKASELLRSGATMLADVCPLCGSPLFKLPSGEVVCPIHGKVMLVKSEEEVSEAGVISTLMELEKSIANKLSTYVNKLKNNSSETEFDDARNIIAWLDALERIEKIKKLLGKGKSIEPKQEQRSSKRSAKE